MLVLGHYMLPLVHHKLPPGHQRLPPQYHRLLDYLNENTGSLRSPGYFPI